MAYQVPSVFRPLWRQQARYKGAHGGRGSAKSHDRAAAAVAAVAAGKRVVGLREVQRSIKDSVKQLVEDKIAALGLSGFTVLRDEVRHASGGLMLFRGMQDHTADSIKSLEGMDVAWTDEAQALSARSLRLLTPTIRTPGSELWFTWNPEHETDPVDRLLRGEHPPAGAIVIDANYWDNPWFPAELQADMERDKATDIELYNHVWCGAYMVLSAGAYYAKQLTQARLDGRMCEIPREVNQPIYTGWDLGIDDVTAIWVCQPVRNELRLLDYYEGRGEDAAHYAQWVRDNDYDTGDALLPHDGAIRGIGSGLTYQEHLTDAGLTRTRIVPRTSDVMGDIQRVRSMLPRCYFADQARVGLKALGSYRVDWDDKAGTPKQRPVHDWASHGADAFRTLMIGLDSDVPALAPVRIPRASVGGWMGA